MSKIHIKNSKFRSFCGLFLPHMVGSVWHMNHLYIRPEELRYTLVSDRHCKRCLKYARQRGAI